MEKIQTVTLTNGLIEAELTNVGGRLMRLAVAGTDVVLGFDRASDYLPENHLSDFGAVIGRYANRLANARFSYGGICYHLPANDGPNTLHGGPTGWQYSLFRVEESSPSHAVFSLHSPDGDNGFPGDVDVRVVYRLLADGTLRIDYHAVADRPTAFNITNHSYFNLDGVLPAAQRSLGTVHDHLLQIAASRYSPVDGHMIPLGEHQPVEGTPFDFRRAKAVGRDIDLDHPQLTTGRGYDHNFVLDHPDLDHIAALLESPRTGISLEVRTTAPGLQLYTGNFLEGTEGKGGIIYPWRSALCLETQQYPNSPNSHWAESTGMLLPEKPFHSTTTIKLRIEN